MEISKEEIVAVKQANDIVAVIKSRGIQLKKKGKNYTALCPFHEEDTPSFTVDPVKQLYHCFGCSSNGKGSTGGDVFGFVVRYDRVSFPKAFSSLSNGVVDREKKGAVVRGQGAGKEGKKGAGCSWQGAEKTKQKNQESVVSTQESGKARPAPCTLKTAPLLLQPSSQKLLKRVISYYQSDLHKNTAGLAYLQRERGIQEKESLVAFGTGFASGNLLKVIPSEGDVVEELKSIGILNSKGNEFFYKSVVFPMLDEKGNIVSVYARRIQNGVVKHLYLPGEKNGIINHQACKRSKTIIITESVIDALTLYDRGFKNVIPCYGTNGLTEDHLSLFNRNGTKEVYVCFDSDPPGEKAAKVICSQLKDRNIITHIVTLPEKDANDFFKTHTPEQFSKLLKEINPKVKETNTKISQQQEKGYQQTTGGFIITYSTRTYEIKGIARQGTQLKATVKAYQSNQPVSDTRFELSTIDLYSSRSREYFAALCAPFFNETEEVIKQDLNRLIERIENYNPNGKKTVTKTMTPSEKKEAMKLLKNPDMFKDILQDFETIGYVGEETNKLLLYVAAVSRKLEEPLSILIQSRSAAGKSSLQDAALKFVPEEDFVKYTRITDQALYYQDENALVHKLLAIEEIAGVGGAAYSLRALLSNGAVTIAYTAKDQATGKMKAEEKRVNGPVSVNATTCDPEIDPELASRCIIPSIDETKEMTLRIHNMQRQGDTIDGFLRRKKRPATMTKHQNAQRLLKTVAVLNPYSEELKYPHENLRTRRDNNKYLILIKAVTLLFQYQRPIQKLSDGTEYIEVTYEDIEMANKIALQVLGHSLDELDPGSARLLTIIEEMVIKRSKDTKKPPEECQFSRRALREYSKWSEWQIRMHIRQLEEFEYIFPRIGKWGKEYVYVLAYAGTSRHTLALTTVEELKEKIKKGTGGSCQGAGKT